MNTTLVWPEVGLTAIFAVGLLIISTAPSTALGSDDLPYDKGEMEIGASLGGVGGQDSFSLALGASFAYYVLPRFAPGLEMYYTVTWGDLEYPQSLSLLPFVKFVLVRSHSFAPYLVVAGGREFEWAGTDDPTKGYAAIGAWTVGGGIGAVIGASRHLAVKVQLLALYYFFDETVLIENEDEPVDGTLYFPVLSLGVLFRP